MCTRMRKNMRLPVAVLAVLLVFLLVMAGAVPAFAADAKPSEKDEVVYADLGDSGQVDRIYVVNVFEGAGALLDYGDYESVRNMTSTDQIRQKGDTIRIDTDQDMLYYQGNVAEGQLPWNIHLTYTLDGKEIAAKDLAGKSGSLLIRIDVEENPQSEKGFFENYALQITAALNTEKCTSIRAEGATLANAGGNRQMTFTLLPGKEKSLEIQADVKDFEMDSISFNGIRLNMDVDVDSKELTSKFDQLSQAVSAIDQGAEQMAAGLEKADSGAKKLKKGTDTLKAQVEKLKKQKGQVEKLGTASGQIKNGVQTLQQGIETAKAAVSYQAYKTAMAQNGLDVDQLKDQSSQAASMLEQMAQQMEGQLPSMPDGPQKESYKQQIQQLRQTKALLQGNIAAMEGTKKYLDSAGSGLTEAVSGAKTLAENYDQFDSGIQQAVDQFAGLDLSGISQLAEGASSLSKGTGQLKEAGSALENGTGQLSAGTSGMSGQVQKQIDDMLKGISGDDAKAKSFVSEKNTNVRSVQFVIKNDPVKISEKEPPEDKAGKERSWWQKLLALFGLS